jgi:hypothetical protein
VNVAEAKLAKQVDWLCSSMNIHILSKRVF